MSTSADRIDLDQFTITTLFPAPIALIRWWADWRPLRNHGDRRHHFVLPVFPS
jgi:hypothetical protein